VCVCCPFDIDKLDSEADIADNAINRGDLIGVLLNIAESPLSQLLPHNLRPELLNEVKEDRMRRLPWPAHFKKIEHRGLSRKDIKTAVATVAWRGASPALSAMFEILSALIITEASVERLFSIVSKIAKPTRSRLTPENVAACLHVNYLLREAQDLKATEAELGQIDDDERDEDEPVVDDVDDAWPIITPKAVSKFILAAVKKYQKEALTAGAAKCQHCRSNIGRSPAIQCRALQCQKVWHINVCAAAGNKLDEEPVNNGIWKCTECEAKALGLDPFT
jgi:hypothetical protein